VISRIHIEASKYRKWNLLQLVLSEPKIIIIMATKFPPDEIYVRHNTIT